MLRLVGIRGEEYGSGGWGVSTKCCFMNSSGATSWESRLVAKRLVAKKLAGSSYWNRVGLGSLKRIGLKAGKLEKGKYRVLAMGGLEPEDCGQSRVRGLEEKAYGGIEIRGLKVSI